MSTAQITILVIVIVVVVLLVVAAIVMNRRRALRQRFGPEYDRAVESAEDRRAAERELRERERRHAELELHPLEPAARERYSTSWEEIQVRFVNSPEQAAEPTLIAATKPEVPGGSYFGPGGFLEIKGPPAPARIARASRDASTATRLWALSEQLTGVSFLN